MKLLKFNPKKNKAQAIVEFAIALPILLLILYGIMETGRYILIVSFVNNASRQAARYGSTSGVGPNNIERYRDCQGIRDAAQKSDFLNAFDDGDITITYDNGTSPFTTLDTCNGTTDTGVAVANGDRVTVEIKADFNAVVPKLVPFISRTVAKGNPIIAKSSRTLVLTISIQKPGSGSTKETTTTTLVGPSNPSKSEIGQSARFTATVAGTTTPTGSVVFKDTTNNVTLCTVTLSGGTAICDYTFTTLSPPIRNISAEYSGDSTHNTSTGTLSHEVTKASVTVTITADSPDPSGVNATLTSVAVTVTSAWTTPTGTVTIGGADTGCTITLSGNSGSCNNTVKFTSLGSKTLTATYNGDTEHNTGTDTEPHTVINGNDTTTTITSVASFSGLTPTLTITVSGITTPAGTVTFKEGSTTLCTATLSGGSGSCTSTTLTPGAHNITATYTSSNGLNSSTASQTVTAGATTTTITAGTPVNGVVPITATVTGSGTPTGTVAITGANTNCTITLASGTGTCNVTFTSSVTNATVTGTYSGDSTHAGSPGTTTVTATVVTNISCAISAYTLNSWSNGFNADPVTIQNTGTTTINNWTLTWTFPNGQTITNMWNGNYTQSGSVVTATNMPYNATIAPGSTVSFGFGGSHTGTNNYPVDFKVNGTSCTPPPVASCSTSTVVVSKMQFVSGNLVLPINNTLPSALLIKDVTVTWYESKGHSTGSDKTLILKTAKIGSTTFWTGSDADGTNTITPASPTYIPTGASTMTFTYHQTQDRWDDESITINLSTPGCTTVVLSAPVGYHQ
ncbi:MAG: Ig-like domain repeat protein [Anaerolineales bacterium]|nr:Ig-like domain repeat protein [Anaerolineales bacterium]